MELNNQEKLVCPGCGNPVEYIDTVNNSGDPTQWKGCKSCSTFGSTTARVYALSVKLVKEFRYRRYTYKDDIDEKDQVRGSGGLAWNIDNLINAEVKKAVLEELEKLLPNNPELTNGWKYESEKYVKGRIEAIRAEYSKEEHGN